MIYLLAVGLFIGPLVWMNRRDKRYDREVREYYGLDGPKSGRKPRGW